MINYPQKLMVALCTIILMYSCTSEEIITEPDNVATEAIHIQPIESEILTLINNHRENLGLNQLKKLEVIKTQTQEHTLYMVDKNELSHDFFHKRKEYLVENANASSVSENVGYGYTSASSLVNAWLQSEGHRKNIEGDFTHFNITAKYNENGDWFYTNIFIKN